MRKKNDFQIPILNRKFGKLTPINRIDNKWECKCECGDLHTIPHKSILSFINGVKLYMMCTRCKLKLYKDPVNSKAWKRVYGNRKIDNITKSYNRYLKNKELPNLLIVDEKLYSNAYETVTKFKKTKVIVVKYINKSGFKWLVKAT